MVQQLVDEGQITPEEALTHPRRSVLMRALSTDHPPEPDLERIEIHVGDRFLLCSDGVTAVLDDGALLEEVSTGEPDDVVRRLIELANERGGPDNITAIVADVVDLPDAEPPGSTEPHLAGAAAEKITPG
jgi:protein phosphatase